MPQRPRYGTWLVGLALALLGVLLLAACSPAGGEPSLGAAMSSSPDVSTIVSKARAAHYIDLTYTLEGEIQAISSSGQDTTTGEGQITTKPKRVHFVQHTTLTSGKVVTQEGIGDEATQTLFAKTAFSGQPTPTQWTKLSASDGQLVSASPPTIAALSHVQLVGSDTVVGVAVWHLMGTMDVSGTHFAVDYYVYQNTYLPAKIHTISSGQIVGETTILVTKYNTGLTIDLPSAGQVLGD